MPLISVAFALKVTVPLSEVNDGAAEIEDSGITGGVPSRVMFLVEE